VSNKSAPIIQIVTGLGVGGAERVVVELARRFEEKGQKTVVFSIINDMSLLKQYAGLNFELINLGVERFNFFSYMSALFRLSSFVKLNGVKIVHAHMYHSFLLVIALKILCGAKFSIVFTSHNYSGFKGLRRFVIRVFRKLRAADVVFALGQHEDMNANRVYVIPNGVEVGSISETRHEIEFKKPFVFLALGRLELQKNPVALVEQFALMNASDTELWFVGRGYLEESVRDKVSALNLHERVRFLGVVTDVPALLTKVNCLVMPSLWEGLPMALLEAGAVSLPVIVTPVGAVPSVVDDTTGYPSSVEDFHIYMDEVYRNYETAIQKGRALREVVLRNFSLETMVDRHLDMYVKVYDSNE